MWDLYLKKIEEDNDFDKDILLVTSSIEYSNDELALKWLKHFEIHSQSLK